MRAHIGIVLSILLLGQGRTLIAGAVPQQLAAGDTVLSPPPEPPAAPRRSADGRLAVLAARAERPVKVDGILDESVWRDAEPVGRFVQSEPRQGEPATEKTVVQVAFDDEYLYIAAHCFDSQPDALVVNDLRQDFDPDNQDTFQVILDTFADRRNGYVFIVNPEGAKVDWQVANEGREVNTSWEAPWTADARQVADGWTTEIAIPFRALRFNQTGGGVWGVNFARNIRRKYEETLWSPIPRSYSIARLSLAGNLEGLPASRGGRDLRVKPYLAASKVRATGGPAFSNELGLGVDLKYGVTDALTLDVTVNPDFAQVEADEQQVNLTQFSQFFPEKRDFFLENSGLFYMGDAARKTSRGIEPRQDTDLLPFFSRRVGLTETGTPVPIDGGLRLTGRAGRLNIGALAMRTRAADDIEPNDYAVVRVRQNLARSSDIGAIFMTRQAVHGAGDYNRVYGIDSNIRFPAEVDWSSYVMRTETPGVSSGQYAYRTSLMREGTFFHVKAGVMSLGDGFNNDLGYYRRIGVRKWLLDTGLRPRFRSLQRLGIREMHPHIVWNYFEDQSGRMVSKRLHTGYSVFLNDGATLQIDANPAFELLEAPFQIARGIPPIPPGEYSWSDIQATFRSDPSRTVSGTIDLIGGGLWTGTQRTVRVSVEVRPSYRLRATLQLSRTAAELDLPEAEFVKSLWTLRANYSFNTNMFVDGLTQYDPERHLFNANVRFNLIHRPLSDLFIVLNEQRFMTSEGISPGRSVILKVTQMLAF
ncbi:MAG: carbohydrate binding family 9 domain-containing protein [Gemmatimonadetes bacterium]|nr:carbohydrate binding family 9 domain-containing protein [Gemmatimonadota bacterium]